MNREEVRKVVAFCFKHQYGGKRDKADTVTPFEYYLYNRYAELQKGSQERINWQIDFYTDEFIKDSSLR